MTHIRRQLTLFVSPTESRAIDMIRRQFNPVQHALIDSHVTLCRDDELLRLDLVLANMVRLRQAPIPIRFGPVRRVAGGAGVLLPAVAPYLPYQQLREQVLRGVVDSPAQPEPHITLIHPRNATCTDEQFARIQAMDLPTGLLFRTVSLIEQVDGGLWQTSLTVQLG
ncbi:hypothetical protein GCM10027578_24030 [Spirosoma luteolum]